MVLYDSFSTGTLSLTPYKGDKVALFVPNTFNDAATNQRLLQIYDQIWRVYIDITNLEPEVEESKVWEERAIIAVIPNILDGDFTSYGSIGETGIEISSAHYARQYDGMLDFNSIDTLRPGFFGANFYRYSDQLGSFISVARGFSNASNLVALIETGNLPPTILNLPSSEVIANNFFNPLAAYLDSNFISFGDLFVEEADQVPLGDYVPSTYLGAIFYQIYDDFGYGAYRTMWRAVADFGDTGISGTPSEIGATAAFVLNSAAATGTGIDYGALFKDGYTVVNGTGNSDALIDLRTQEDGTRFAAFGLTGDDNMIGREGREQLFGGPGDDTMTGLGGSDQLIGGSGNDLMYGNIGRDTLFGGTGEDTGFGGQGVDILSGMDGNDVLYGNLDNDEVIGGNGDDRLYGGRANDLLDGGAGNDTIYGNLDTDTLLGGDGQDFLYGGPGDDSISAGNGDDTAVGGDGADYIDGGAGVNWLSFAIGDGFQGAQVNLGISQATDTYNRVDTIANFQHLIGSPLNDNLTGTSAGNWILAGAGRDTIDGGAGNDSLAGGLGADMLTGGLGADIFILVDAADAPASEGGDVILDFHFAEGDRIDLTRMDGNVLVGGRQGFAFIGGAGFSGGAGEIRSTIDPANGGVVEIDLDGDRAADVVLLLPGSGAVSAEAFFW